MLRIAAGGKSWTTALSRLVVELNFLHPVGRLSLRRSVDKLRHLIDCRKFGAPRFLCPFPHPSDSISIEDCLPMSVVSIHGSVYQAANPMSVPSTAILVPSARPIKVIAEASDDDDGADDDPKVGGTDEESDSNSDSNSDSDSDDDGFADDDEVGVGDGFRDGLDEDDELDEFDDIDEDDFDDDFDDDFEEELNDDYEITIDDEISAESDSNTDNKDGAAVDDGLDDFEDFEKVE
jgi:hypothetical protein